MGCRYCVVVLRPSPFSEPCGWQVQEEIAEFKDKVEALESELKELKQQHEQVGMLGGVSL